MCSCGVAAIRFCGVVFSQRVAINKLLFIAEGPESAATVVVVEVVEVDGSGGRRSARL